MRQEIWKPLVYRCWLKVKAKYLGCEKRVKNGTLGNSNLNKCIKEEEGLPGGSVVQNPLLMQETSA